MLSIREETFSTANMRKLGRAGACCAVLSLLPCPGYSAALIGEQQLGGYIRVVDTRDGNAETTGHIQNTSDHWLSRVRLLVRYHPLHPEGQSDKRDAAPDAHAEVLIDQPIAPGATVPFRAERAPNTPEGLPVTSAISVVAVQPFMSR